MNVGKANETTPEEQAILEAQSKWEKKQRSGGYWQNISDIDKSRYTEPMLCKKFVDYQDKMTYPVAIEDKLNGICCVAVKGRAHSRKGEDFWCVEHIKEELAPIFEQYPELYLHGELFNYEFKNLLNRIASLVSVNRTEKDVKPTDTEESKKIVRLYVYDGYCNVKTRCGSTFRERKARLIDLLAGLEYVKVLDYELAYSEEAVFAALKKAAKNKSEGVVVKVLEAPYEHKRSKNTLKLKNFTDEEFEVLGFEEGSGNWAGCAKKVICKLNKPATNGKTDFKSNIRGTQAELADLLKNGHKHIGKKATVDFQEYSEFRIPLIPYTQLPFRDYEEKPEGELDFLK